MKHFVKLIRTATASFAFLVLLAGCGEKESKGTEGDAGTPGGLESLEPSDGGKAGGLLKDAAELEARLFGFWAPDVDAIVAKRTQQPHLPPLQNPEMFDLLTFELKKGEILIHGPRRTTRLTYTVTFADKSTNTLLLDTREEGAEQAVSSTLFIDGDRLTMDEAKGTTIVDRIDEAAFQKRMEEARKRIGGGAD